MVVLKRLYNADPFAPENLYAVPLRALQETIDGYTRNDLLTALQYLDKHTGTDPLLDNPEKIEKHVKALLGTAKRFEEIGINENTSFTAFSLKIASL